MEAENEKGEDGQRVQQLLQVIAELKVGPLNPKP